MRKDQTTTKSVWPWAAWLVAICAAIIAFGFLHSWGDASSIAYLVGYNLPIGLIVWGIFQIAVGRGRRGAAVAFFAIWGALVAGSFIGYMRQREEAAQAVSEIQSSYADLIAKSGMSAGTFSSSGSTSGREPQPSGQFGEMTKYMKDLMSKASSLQENYKDALRKIGWDTILDPSRLQRDMNLTESKEILRKASDIVLEYHAKNDQLLITERAEIANLNVSAHVKEAMQRGFDKNAEAGRKQIDSMWAMQSRILSQVTDIINLLGERHGNWRVEGKHIMFSNPGDLDAFNSDLHNIRELVIEERAMHKRSALQVDSNLNKLKEELSQ